MNFYSFSKPDFNDGDPYFCNLYRMCKSSNNSSRASVNLKECINETHGRWLDGECDIVTHSGDFGIIPCRNSDNVYKLSHSPRCSPSFNIEIDSVARSVSRWFCTNMSHDIRENIFPVPVNVVEKPWEFDMESVIRSDIRHIEKTNLCIASFLVNTSARISIAEWASEHDAINHFFPMLYPTQGVELETDIFSDEKQTMYQRLRSVASHRFAICPIGRSVDTRLVWECILCNTVPIVQDTWCNRVFSRIWPMILVQNYEYSDIMNKANDFTESHGLVEYDYSLLLKKNFHLLLDRVQYESVRARRQGV